MDLVEVDRVFDSVGAEIIRGYLASAGIAAVLFDSGLASLLGGVSGVRVMVAPDDVAAARALLAEIATP
jgi:hypothetical protein